MIMLIFAFSKYQSGCFRLRHNIISPLFHILFRYTCTGVWVQIINISTNRRIWILSSFNQVFLNICRHPRFDFRIRHSLNTSVSSIFS